MFQSVRAASLILYLDNSAFGWSTDYMMPQINNDFVNAFFPNTLQSKAYGVHMDISYPRTQPTSDVTQLSLAPGVETTVTLSSVDRQRLPQPYGHCTTATQLDGINCDYTVQGCYYACYIQKVSWLQWS